MQDWNRNGKIDPLDYKISKELFDQRKTTGNDIRNRGNGNQNSGCITPITCFAILVVLGKFVISLVT